MTALESAMLVVLSASLLIALVPIPRRPAWFGLAQMIGPVGVAILFQLHAAIDGPRREMMPAYALGFLLLLVAGLRFLAGRGRPDSEPPNPSTAERTGTVAAALAGLALVAYTARSLWEVG